MSEKTDPPRSVRRRVRRDSLLISFRQRMRLSVGKPLRLATPRDQFVAAALAVRDCVVDRLIRTAETYETAGVKRAYYLSLEYLIGQSLRNNLVNLGVYDSFREGLRSEGVDLEAVCKVEPDAGLGNGGLGRLAACYLDSAATMHLPLYGYGLRYDCGIFEQEISDGWQVERPDYWLRFGSPWEIARPEYATTVRFFGRVEHGGADGRFRPRWVGGHTVMGAPYDIPIVGYGGTTVNMLRLWSAQASETLDLEAFNRGGFVEAVRGKVQAEIITKVLYPNDQTDAGRELRLMQQYFFVACTLADILRRHERGGGEPAQLPDKVVLQLNDTHPALAIAELMRILIDERQLTWEGAWDITRRCFAYTNHTLLPEALEVWPIGMFEYLLPRHLQIVFELNRRFLESVARRWPNDGARLERMSLIQERPYRGVRMAHLAMLGSFSVNGVAELHSRLIRRNLAPDFAAMWPERFNNKTNGVTQRRWLLSCNPALAELITRRIGSEWITDLERLRELEPFAHKAAFQEEFWAVRRAAKQRLADTIHGATGLEVSVDALFDVQVKRLHEYKRQLLNLLQVVIRYQTLLDNPSSALPPRVVIFAGKAAPGYATAKLIIKLIHDVAETINHDSRLGGRLKVIFLPNYRVSLAERIIPAADLSEQISTAGLEASGTGNMKFAMNGALTIGTLDGANIEIRQAVGADHFFLFGLTADEVAQRRQTHDPARIYAEDPLVRRALDAISGGEFNRNQPNLYQPLVNSLVREGDRYILLADVGFYLEAQARVDAHWSNPAAWARSSILNIARIGRFSSDRAVREYACDTWGIEPCPPLRKRLKVRGS